MTRSDTERHNAATRRLYDPAKNAAIRAFRAVDGEGGNVPELVRVMGEMQAVGNRHQYLSLRAGDRLLETGKPLSWEECFRFLCDLPRYCIPVAYFFDYDVTMMIRTLPQEVAVRLLERHKRSDGHGHVTPVKHGGFEFDYLPHKEFKVRPAGRSWWSVVSDTGSFFQMSFLKTLQKWNIGTPEEQEMIRRGKEMRADFAETDEEIRAYNALECLLLEQLMTEFRNVCEDIGYLPGKWQGPGNLAAAMLKTHNVPTHDDIPIMSNHTFRMLAQESYYGGRFEITCTGHISQAVYQYDINSAYPYIIRSLPCLIHGSWKRVKSMPESGLWFGAVKFTTNSNTLCNLPVRLKNGNIRYPRNGAGVYWSDELEAAQRAGTVITEFREGYVYEKHCDCKPFAFIDDVYRKRIEVGKGNKGYALKLAINSLYGKMAQSIGAAPWANPVYASLITSGCRAMIIDAYQEDPGACVMIATDGIFMTKPVTTVREHETDLGAWEMTRHDNGIFIVQPGIYFLNDDAKTRGVEHVRIASMRPEFEDALRKFIESRGVDHKVTVEVTNFITARQAITWRKWHLAGTWDKTTRQIGFDWSSKREPYRVSISDDGMIRTYPYEGSQDEWSVPYSRVIGGNTIMSMTPEEAEGDESPGLAERSRQESQPDWLERMF